MSIETLAAAVEDARGATVLRRSAFRLAFAVTGSFAVAEALDWDFTFVGPTLAAQWLVKLTRPPTIGQVFTLIVYIALTTGFVLLLSTSLIGAPAVLIVALGLVLFLTYFGQSRGAPELLTFLLQVAAVTIPVFAVISTDTAAGFAATLLKASVLALGAIWAAFAIFPAPDVAAATPPRGGLASLEPAEAARGALHNTLIVMPILTWYVLDATQIAIVVLMTVVTVLRQRDPRQGTLLAAWLVLGNFVGGLAAALAYNLVLLRDSLLSFVLVCLVASLLFAGRIVMGGPHAPALAVAFATFILLLGLGLSPVPGGSGEVSVARLVNVLLAATYTVGALSILQRVQDRNVAASVEGPASA